MIHLTDLKLILNVSYNYLGVFVKSFSRTAVYMGYGIINSITAVTQ